MSDFRYRVLPSPIGQILVVTVNHDASPDDTAGSPPPLPDGIVLLHPFDGPVSYALERATVDLRASPRPDDEIAPTAAQQLTEYFDGRRDRFDLALDWRLVRGFTRDALQAICDIPYGETASYGEVAIMAGRPRAARAVGTACASTPFSVVVPVHRVIRSDGSIGEYGGHPEVKRFLLDLESRTSASAVGV